MGILNLSPDSFSQDGLLIKNKKDLGKILAVVEKFIRDGCDILDVGGESTRPGSQSISAKEEMARIIPVIKTLSKKIKIPISVDTYKPFVAQHALDAGAAILNDIMRTPPKSSFLKMVQRYNAAIVLMHIRGRPRTMQKKIHYKNLMKEITSELKESIEKCLEIGINSDKIIVDPGIGFGKAVSHNLEMIRRLRDLQILNRPILIGPSRKSFIGYVLGKNVTDRLMGTAAAVVCSILNGVHIVRIHDVGPLKDAIRMTDSVLNYQRWQNL